MMKTPVIFTFLLVIIVLIDSGVMQNSDPIASITVPLNIPQQFEQQALSYNYYQTSVNNPNQNQVLLITLSADTNIWIGIFVSTSDSPTFINGSWPNRTSYTQECFYSSIDTCAIRMPDVSKLPNGQKTLKVYFTVYVSNDCIYSLVVSLETVYPLRANAKYTVNLNNAQSAIAQLPASSFVANTSQKIQQIIITCVYTSDKSLGHFQLLASVDRLPNPTQSVVIQSKSLNMMTQILELSPLNASTSSYFILIEGQNNTKLNLSVQTIESLDSPKLIMNETLSYLSNHDLNYTYNNIFALTPVNSTLRTLHIKLIAYRGYGRFAVDYCNGLYNYTFQNAGGEGGQIVITTQMRNQCLDYVSSAGGLLVQNLIVGVIGIYYQFGYGIGLYEDTYDIFLMPSQKQIGTLNGADSQAVYKMQTFNTDINFTLTVQIIVGSINVTIQQCPLNEDNYSIVNSTTLIDPSKVLAKVNFTCPGQSSCQVVVSQYLSANYSKYSLLNQYTNKDNSELLMGKPTTDMVLMNDYKFYFINVSALRLNSMTKFTNATTINIRTTPMNGDIIMLTSLKLKQPTFWDIFDFDSDVQYDWEDTATYVANLTYPDYIYIGIGGDSESIYHIQFTLNISANIPSAYLDMVESGQNDYILTSEAPYILLKYVSHIVPYTITFNPAPSCIKYSNKLPVTNICTSASAMSNAFHDNVLYFNVSQTFTVSDAMFKFSSYVNSGSYFLTQDKPILISCDRSCYQLIIVSISSPSANILHSGSGTIQFTNSKGQNISINNGVITLTCSTTQCSFTLNASLWYGGSMEVSFQSYTSEIEWRTKSMALPTEGAFKYFYMMIPKYTLFSSLIFYAEAADLSIYYNIFALNESYSNTMSYTYPNSTNYMEVSYGDPLQQVHVVDINPSKLSAMKCYDYNVICIATFAVALNTSVQYSLDYIKSGLGYYSSNVYQYQIDPTWPILSLKQQYSLSYFSYQIDFSKYIAIYPFIVHIKPLSNCRPQIQTQSTYYLKNYYSNITLPYLMPGQIYINYRIISNQICLFNTAVTTSPFQLVFPNIMYKFQGNNGKDNITVTYQHTFYRSNFFVVKLSSPVAAIIIKKITFKLNSQVIPEIVLPSLEQGGNDGYILNSSTFISGEMQAGQYLILLKLSDGAKRPNELTVMVQMSNKVITLLHNQQHVYTYNPSSNSLSAETSKFVSYQYHSTSGFYIFVQVNKLSVRLTVRDADGWGSNAEIANVIISNMSQPWILINPFNTSNSSIQKLTNFNIDCQFLQDPPTGSTVTLKLHIEQDGIKGLTQIYPGISIYDAFVHDTAINCYKFISPMILGQQNITIDLNFLAKQHDVDGNITDFIVGTASVLENSDQLYIKKLQITPTTHRMVIDFYLSSTYKICYELKSIKMVGIQYSVVVNVPSMPMIYANAYPSQSDLYQSTYSVFEYINHYYDVVTPDVIHSQPIVMTVINCFGASSILAALSYSDMQTGKITEVSSEWSSNGVAAALVNVPHGYYYFAVKPKSTLTSKQLFRTTVLPAGIVYGKASIIQSLYNIIWNANVQFTQITNDNDENTYINIQVPTLFQSASSGENFNPDKIVYSLYAINLGNDSGLYQYQIDSYIRCPSLWDQENIKSKKPFTPIATKTILDPFNSPASIQFNIDASTFYPISNISIKAQVYVNDSDNNTNIYEFYYGKGQIDVQQNVDDFSIWKPLKWILVLFIVSISLGSIIITCKIYLRKKKRTVSFEAADHPMAREMQVRTPQSNTSGASTNRKPLNQNTAYGQFVDQS